MVQKEAIVITDKNRKEMIHKYTRRIIDAMDFQQLLDYAYEGIVTNLNNYSNEELEAEITEFNPELLGKQEE